MNSEKTWIARLLITFLCLNIIRADYFDACSTPDGKDGNCVPLPSCASDESKFFAMQNGATNLDQEYQLFLLQSNCSRVNYLHICCPTNQLQYNSNTLSKLRSLKCGLSSKPKIANGYEVAVGLRPWMALLLSKDYDFYQNPCVGTLIFENFVLTAAHCFASTEHNINKVRLGEHIISTNPDCVYTGEKPNCSPPVEDFNIDKVFIHEKYKSTEHYNDIALIRLKTPVSPNLSIPICLPITEELRGLENTIENFYITGWGQTENNKSSDVLREGSIQKVSDSDCARQFPKEIRQTQFCAGDEQKIESCLGDSGGPVQWYGRYVEEFKIRMIQFGIISTGYNSCGSHGLPDVYTKISQYMHWITDKMDSP